MLTIRQATDPADIADLRELVREFTEWAIGLDPDTGDAPTFADLEAELAALPGAYAPPTGCFLLARDDGAPVGCAAFIDRGGNVVEVKRMYVRPGRRGAGTGRQLVAALLEEARRRGAARVILDSFHTMTAAHRIYRAAGFRDVDAPPDFPAAFRDRVVFMAMDLD